MDDYFIYDGIKSTDKNIFLKSYKIIFLPEDNTVYKNIPGKIGSLEGTSRGLKDIIISCEVAILGEGSELISNIENANYWLSQNNKLKFWNMIDKYYIGKLIGSVDVEDKDQWGEFNLQFRCFPLKISETRKEIDNIHAKTLINQGTYKTTGILLIKVSSNVNNLKVTLQNTGEYIYLEDNLKKDDVVEINLEDEYIKKNGLLIMDKLHFESDFFELPIGEFNITSSNGIMDIEFRERWL